MSTARPRSCGRNVTGKLRFAGVSDETIQTCRAEARVQANRAMQLFASALGANGRVSHLVEFGHAPSVIREQAEEIEPDLIVMGTRGMGTVANLVLGSGATKIIHLAKIPVTLVK